MAALRPSRRQMRRFRPTRHTPRLGHCSPPLRVGAPVCLGSTGHRRRAMRSRKTARHSLQRCGRKPRRSLARSAARVFANRRCARSRWKCRLDIHHRLRSLRTDNPVAARPSAALAGATRADYASVRRQRQPVLSSRLHRADCYDQRKSRIVVLEVTRVELLACDSRKKRHTGEQVPMGVHGNVFGAERRAEQNGTH